MLQSLPSIYRTQSLSCSRIIGQANPYEIVDIALSLSSRRPQMAAEGMLELCNNMGRSINSSAIIILA